MSITGRSSGLLGSQRFQGEYDLDFISREGEVVATLYNYYTKLFLILLERLSINFSSLKAFH